MFSVKQELNVCMLFRGTSGLECFQSHSGVSASFKLILFYRICSCSYSGKKKILGSHVVIFEVKELKC